MRTQILESRATSPDAAFSGMIPVIRRKRIRRRLFWGVLSLLLGLLLYPRLLGFLILRAADHGDASEVRLFLRLGANPDAFGWYLPSDETPLMLAASNGSLATVRLLLDHGANVNTNVNGMDTTPLMRAAESGHPAIVRLLIARGARLNAEDVWHDTVPRMRTIIRRLLGCLSKQGQGNRRNTIDNPHGHS